MPEQIIQGKVIPTQICCANCSAMHGHILFDVPEFDNPAKNYQICQCAECQLVQTQPSPSPEDLSLAYSDDYYGGDKSKFSGFIEAIVTVAVKSRAKKILGLTGSKKSSLRILDIGCGRGLLMNAFRELGHDVVGLERSDSPFIDQPNVICGELGDIDMSAGCFDLILIWHVLEHLEEPANTLKQAKALLADDGSLFIAVPNFGSWQSRLFGANWFHLDIPRHLFHFSEGSIRKMLVESGFKLKHYDTFSFTQNVFGFVQSAFNQWSPLSNNHLYSLLKFNRSSSSLLCLVLYSPFVLVLSILAIIELPISELVNKGGSITIKAVKETDD